MKILVIIYFIYQYVKFILYFNIFFIKQDLSIKAPKNKLVLLIPQLKSFKKFTFNKSIIDNHILKPSPYFINEMVTFSNLYIYFESGYIYIRVFYNIN